jgi:tetratricopeptide (TPR) repeat protein
MPGQAVYEDNDILVAFHSRGSVSCFVTFTGVGNHQGNGFGQGFFGKKGHSGLFFISKWDHWYQVDGMAEALARSSTLLGEHKFRDIIAYGASMGGYGVLSNSKALNISQAIIFAPQFSVDGVKVPFESRWRREAKNLVFSRDDMAGQIANAAKKTILFDPVSVDRLHADLFAKLPNVDLLSVPMGGHIPTRMLQDVGMLDSTVMGLVERNFDRNQFFAQLHATRRKSLTYWQGLAEAAAARRPHLALHALSRGLMLKPTDTAMLLHRATLLTRVRRFQDALVAAEAIVGVSPQHPAAWRALSNANRSLNRGAEAVTAARKAVELRPKDADLWRVLQEALMLTQDYDEAVTVGQEAISLAPTYAHSYLRTAQALREQGKRKAVEMLAKGIALTPTNEVWAKILEEWRGDLADKPF